MSKGRRKITLQTMGQWSTIYLSVQGAYPTRSLVLTHPSDILAQAYGSNTCGKLQQDSITIPVEDLIYMVLGHFSN